MTATRRSSRRITSARKRFTIGPVEERSSVRRDVHVAHEPPENELPVVLAPGISWTGAGVVFAIPALLLYSAGLELLIMYRSQRAPVVTGDDLTAEDIAGATILLVSALVSAVMPVSGIRVLARRAC